MYEKQAVFETTLGLVGKADEKRQVRVHIQTYGIWSHTFRFQNSPDLVTYKSFDLVRIA